MRTRMRAASPTVFLSLLAALFLPLAAAASGRPLPPPEVPDDPPGIPATPVPGAPRAEPVRFRQYTAHQVNVSVTGVNIPGDAANEPSIAVNPLEPNKMAIGWRQFDTVSSNFRQAGAAFTTDGGRTWFFFGSLTPGVFRSDPVLASDKNGVFYYSSLQNNFLVDMFRSTNGGMNWSAPVPAFGGDKQWFTIDRTTGTGSGHIYQAWSTAGSCCGSNIFTRSINGGQSFQTPVTIPNTPVWGTLDVAPDGTLYQVGSDFGSPIHVARSTNARDPLQTPTFETVTVDLGGSLGFSAGPNPGGLLGQLWIAVDPSSGPRHGWVYVLASVDPAGTDPLDVHFARSTDGGVSFSPWVRVNDDQAGPNFWQWFATMSVAPNGRIDAVWNDTRDTGIPNYSALYYSYSIDGGVTWSANERVSEWWDSFIGYPQQNKIGDYYHMVSDAVGASLAWAATFNNEQDVYYTRIGDYDCNVNAVPDTLDIQNGTSADANGNGIPDECETITAVELAEFTARGDAGAIVLSWTAHSEVDHLGYHIWRAEESGEYERLTGPEPLTGESPYMFTDRTAVAGRAYRYRLEALSRSGDSEFFGPTDWAALAMPVALALHPSAPNPFHPATALTFDLPERATIRLVVFDLTGRTVREVASGAYPAGRHTVTWDGRADSGDAASAGIYVARLSAGDRSSTRKLVLIQ